MSNGVEWCCNSDGEGENGTCTVATQTVLPRSHVLVRQTDPKCVHIYVVQGLRKNT